MWAWIWVVLTYAMMSPLVHSQNTLPTTLPPILPLALKSPYLHAWTSNSNVTFSFPMFWNKDNLGWEGMIRVDNHTYQWLGHSTDANPEPANLTSTQVTPTRTIFTYLAGPALLTATFLSPIETSDFVKQSIPFAYVALDVSFKDGAQHSVQVYMDITGEWLAATPLESMTWSSSIVGSSSFHQIQRNSIQPLIETAQDRAEDLISILGTKAGADVSLVVGLDRDCRVQFRDSGVVTGSSSVSAPIQVGFPYPVFSITKSLGTTSNTTSPVVFAIGAYRNPSVSYITSTGQTQSRAPLFAATYGSISDTVDAFLSDYGSTKLRADKVDTQILKAAANVSDIYPDFVSVAARQAMAATELTIANGSDGKWNTSDIKMFIKDIGRNNRTSPVEMLYASFPFFLSINSTYAGYLLSPLLEFQDSSSYTQAYAAQDLGNTYPRASGQNVQHQQPVEHTSSMLIMMLAYTKMSGNQSLISRHYSLLRKWAEYLVDSAMSPPDTITIDGEAQLNSTNLVVKGIIALKAMSEISSILGQKDDTTRYSQFASSHLSQWLSRTLTSDNKHLLPKPNSNDMSAWAQIYNLYADILLGTNLISDDVYKAQASFHQSQLSRSTTSFGLPLDSTTTLGNMAWTLFTAATISNSSIRKNLISPLWAYATQASGTQPLVANYSVNGLSGPQGAPASPALGAIFAPLIFSSSLNSGTSGTGSGTSGSGGSSGNGSAGAGSNHSIAGAAAGGTVGGVVFIVLVVLGIVLWRRRRNASKPSPPNESGAGTVIPSPFFSPTTTPGSMGECSPGLPSASSKGRRYLYTEDSPTTLTPSATPVLNVAQDNSPSSDVNSESAPPAPASPTPPPPPQQATPAPVPPEITGELQVLRAEVQALRLAMDQNAIENLPPPPSYTRNP